MNRSNYQCPPNPQNGSCCHCLRNDYSRKGGRGARYARYVDSSPTEGDDDEDEIGNRNFRKFGKPFACDEVYDDLIDLIDDQMISTMSTLRKKARKFMKSEMESFSSENTSRPCTCPEEIRSRGSIMKKANEIDYQPQSAFLKKMVKQYQCKQGDYSDFDESDLPTTGEERPKSKSKQRKFSQANSPSVVDQKGPSSCCCTCNNPSSPVEDNECSQEKLKKSEHVSRSKKKIKCRGNRKRKPNGKNESGDRFQPNLKQPHENSCERCWRYASPSRSPVNKPDQRYDPNFRRGRSCMNLDPQTTEEVPEKKENCNCPRKKSQPSPDTNKSNRTPSNCQTTTPKKPAQIQNAPCEDYSPRYSPFSERRGTSCRSQSREQSKPCTAAKELEFEYPSPRPPDTSRISQQRCTPRPQSCDKVRQKGSLEKGITYSSNVRNLLTKPLKYIPSVCSHNKEGENRGSAPSRDICGRGKLETLDPCLKRSPRVKLPCQDAEFSTPRGDTSRTDELGMSRTSGLEFGMNDFNRSAHSEMEAVLAQERNNDSTQRAFITSTPKSSKNELENLKKAKAKSQPPPKSPKSPKTPKSSRSPKSGKKSPRESKEKKGSSRDKKKPCSTNEAQAYFKMPTKPNLSETCGVSHPIQNCRCYPRSLSNSSDSEVYCCHCDWKNRSNMEPKKLNFEEAASAPSNGGCCSGRFPLPVPSTSQALPPNGPSTRHLQKPTLPNIDEYPEQMIDSPLIGVDYPETVLPCPYREYTNKRLIKNSPGTDQLTCENGLPERTMYMNPPTRYEGANVTENNLYFRNENSNNLYSGNGNVSHRSDKRSVCFREENISCRNGNANANGVSGNLTGNCPTYGKKHISFENCGMPQQMNVGCGMEYPRKYCVMYMTKGKENGGDDVEVLVEELTQPCSYGKDSRMADVSEKMTRVFKCPTESMALRFQKGVSERSKAPQKSRVLYF